MNDIFSAKTRQFPAPIFTGALTRIVILDQKVSRSIKLFKAGQVKRGKVAYFHVF